MRCLAVLGVLVGLSSPAAAYSDHNLYEVPAIEGGADSRYFTGSKADGYSCSVCHTGGTSDDFTVEGLPQAVVAGQSYDLVIRWRRSIGRHGELQRRVGPRRFTDRPTLDDSSRAAVEVEMRRAGRTRHRLAPCLPQQPRQVRCFRHIGRKFCH